jgi:SHS2 domain-containing protein
MAYYTTIDHTADMGIRVWGADPGQLFVRAGTAMFDLITDIGNLKKEHRYQISITGLDWPDLMVTWLRELLYLWSGKEMLVQHIDIETIEPFFLSANVNCTHFDPFYHGIKHDIKAVTYHQIEVSQTSKGWTSTIIFDV